MTIGLGEPNIYHQ